MILIFSWFRTTKNISFGFKFVHTLCTNLTKKSASISLNVSKNVHKVSVEYVLEMCTECGNRLFYKWIEKDMKFHLVRNNCEHIFGLNSIQSIFALSILAITTLFATLYKFASVLIFVLVLAMLLTNAPHGICSYQKCPHLK